MKYTNWVDERITGDSEAAQQRGRQLVPFARKILGQLQMRLDAFNSRTRVKQQFMASPWFTLPSGDRVRALINGPQKIVEIIPVVVGEAVEEVVVVVFLGDFVFYPYDANSADGYVAPYDPLPGTPYADDPTGNPLMKFVDGELVRDFVIPTPPGDWADYYVYEYWLAGSNRVFSGYSSVSNEVAYGNQAKLYAPPLPDEYGSGESPPATQRVWWESASGWIEESLNYPSGGNIQDAGNGVTTVTGVAQLAWIRLFSGTPYIDLFGLDGTAGPYASWSGAIADTPAHYWIPNSDGVKWCGITNNYDLVEVTLSYDGALAANLVRTDDPYYSESTTIVQTYDQDASGFWTTNFASATPEGGFSHHFQNAGPGPSPFDDEYLVAARGGKTVPFEYLGVEGCSFEFWDLDVGTFGVWSAERIQADEYGGASDWFEQAVASDSSFLGKCNAVSGINYTVYDTGAYGVCGVTGQQDFTGTGVDGIDIVTHSDGWSILVIHYSGTSTTGHLTPRSSADEQDPGNLCYLTLSQPTIKGQYNEYDATWPYHNFGRDAEDRPFGVGYNASDVVTAMTRRLVYRTFDGSTCGLLAAGVTLEDLGIGDENVSDALLIGGEVVFDLLADWQNNVGDGWTQYKDLLMPHTSIGVNLLSVKTNTALIMRVHTNQDQDPSLAGYGLWFRAILIHRGQSYEVSSHQIVSGSVYEIPYYPFPLGISYNEDGGGNVFIHIHILDLEATQAENFVGVGDPDDWYLGYRETWTPVYRQHHYVFNSDGELIYDNAGLAELLGTDPATTELYAVRALPGG